MNWKYRAAVVLGVTMAAVACSRDDERPGERAAAAPGGAAEAAPVVNAPPWDSLQARVEARLDTVDAKLRKVRGLSARERRDLRRDVNAVQTARARAMGIRAGENVDPLIASGKLVPLEDSTRLWVVDSLDYSVPYVTPSTHAMLAEVGERFQAELDSLGLPPMRMVVTSVLRTAETQRKLRRSNSNAARGVSAHEFGTTLDVAYRRFAPPAPSVDTVTFGAPPQLEPQIRVLQDSLFMQTAKERAAELQAILGRVIKEMRAEGKLMVMMERSQTVYHMTVARRMEPRTASLE